MTAAASAGTAVVLLIAADDIVEFVVTARQAAARRGNEQFRALVNAAPIAVVGSDLEDKINVWNPAAERLFGWRPEEVLGKTIPIVPPDRNRGLARIQHKSSRSSPISPSTPVMPCLAEDG